MKAEDLLFTIPVYKMAVYSERFLSENNPGLSFIQLLRQLPNSGNINHLQAILYKSIEQREKYYKSYLILETKVFCKNMLLNTGQDLSVYREVVESNNLQNLFEVIGKNKNLFFKNILNYDLARFDLYKGYLEQEILDTDDIQAILQLLKKYLVTRKLYKLLKEEIDMLYGKE